ncbi:MAG: endonuclease/exonuclease/phosphatase family protein [Clostridia bacterium]|nr:endonuclease/exonuclease/phosphatase family protein [Clostridia bacterium]
MSLNLHGTNSDGQTIKNLPAGSTATVDATIANRLPGIAAMIRGEEIDVFGAQECTAAWLSALDEELNEFSYVGKSNTTHGEGGYIFYRTDQYTLINNGTFYLANGAPTISTQTEGISADRVCSWALLQVTGTDDYFLFMDTHLTAATSDNLTSFAAYHGLDSATADDVTNYQAAVIVNEIADILSACGKDSTCPVILVGDMNAESTTKTYATLTADLKDACVEADSPYVDYNTGYSYNYVDPTNPSYRIDGHRIDYILVNDAVTVVSYDMIHTSTNLSPYKAANGDGYISDHNAVIAQIQIGDGE